MFTMLFATAFADLPSAMTQMTTDANNAFAGSDPITETAPIRLRPSTLQNQMQQILDKLSAGGCTMGEVQGFASGAYGGGVADGSADSGGSVALTYTTAPKLVSGTYDGAVAGGNFGAYKGGKVVFDIDDSGSFFAGRLVRVKGATGIFMGMTGSCVPEGSVESSLTGWFRGDLTGLDAASDEVDLTEVDTTLVSESRNVYVFKSDSTLPLVGNYDTFCEDRGLLWYEPMNSTDAQNIITGLFNVDSFHTWIITKNPTSAGTWNGFSVTVDLPSGVHYVSSPGEFSAIRKWGNSYCDPSQSTGTSACWDSHVYDWLVCE